MKKQHSPATITEAGSGGLADTVRTFFTTLFVIQVVVEVLCAFSTGDFKKGLLFLGLNLTLGSAAGLVGGLLGFVFGIPRALAGVEVPSPAPSGDDRKSRPNTNLEQISDWLTKILVGASLAGLATAPSAIWSFATTLDHGVYAGLPGGGTLAVFIVIFFVALGFFWSYVETRTLLTVLFDTYSAPIGEDVLLKARSAPWEPGTSPIPEDSVILAMDPKSLTTPALLEVRGASETRAGNLTEAKDFYQRALGLDPGNPRLQIRLSAILARLGSSSEADTLVRNLSTAAASNPTQQSQVLAVKVGNALYKPAPQGFTEAIETGEPLIAGDQGSNGQLHLWMACAYAQRYANANKVVVTISMDDPDRALALARLRDMKRLRPDLLPLARSLWRPDEYGGVPGENDLAAFRDDDEFKAVLTTP